VYKGRVATGGRGVGTLSGSFAVIGEAGADRVSTVRRRWASVALAARAGLASEANRSSKIFIKNPN